MQLPLVTCPAKTLSIPSEKVTVFDAALFTLAEQMNETMIAKDGVGLAAPQIGKNIRMVIVKEEDERGYTTYVNPSITYASKKKIAIEEGCLSIPGVWGYVERSAKLRIQYQDLQGKKHSEKVTGMAAIVLQHEIDHINGYLIINRTITITKGHELYTKWLETNKPR